MSAAVFFTAGNCISQTLFTYGKYPVSKDEFLRAYNKNNAPVTDKATAMREYFDLYANFKLKVKAAEEMKLDTLPQLRADLDNFRQQVQDNYMNDEKGLSVLMDEAFARSQKDLHVLHFSIPVPEDATATDTARIFKNIKSLQSNLSKGGTDYEKLAGDLGGKFSDLGFITVFSLPYNYENLVYSMRPGQVSDPVRSRYAWHIFKLVDERKSIGKWKVAQILLAYPPDADEKVKKDIMTKAESIYAEAKKGADFGKLASQYSEDRYTYLGGGELPEFGTGKYEPAFEDQVLALKRDGEISKPFASSYGVHILKRLGHTDMPMRKDDPVIQFEHKQKILQDSRIEEAKQKFAKEAMKVTGFKLTNAVKEADLFRFADSVLVDLSENKADSYPISNKILFRFKDGSKKGSDWLNFVRDYKGNASLYQKESDKGLWEKFQNLSILEYYKNHLEEFNQDFAYQMKEFRDGNMLFEVMERNVWGKASADSEGLKKYYSEHMSSYKWPESADVILVTASDDKTAQQTKADLESGKSWKLILEDGNALVQLDSGRYELSQVSDSTSKIKPVDGSYSKFVNNPDGSVSFTKYLHIYPANQQRSFEEARGLVINDYQGVLEKKWLEELRKKYPVKLDEAVFRQMTK
jgi:peptidyl-prolyl cis-trans isomerase SurA